MHLGFSFPLIIDMEEQYIKAKTSEIREHYIYNFGAIPFSRHDPFLLLIDGDAAWELFSQYLEE